MMSFRGNFAIATPPPRSDLQRAVHAGDGVASEPDGAAVELDGDPAVAAEAAALSGDIRLGFQHAVPAHERGHAPVAASAHRILGDPVARRERAHLEIGARAPRIEAEPVAYRYADRAQRSDPAYGGRERRDG